jgi:hypothetical protein
MLLGCLAAAHVLSAEDKRKALDVRHQGNLALHASDLRQKEDPTFFNLDVWQTLRDTTKLLELLSEHAA